MKPGFVNRIIAKPLGEPRWGCPFGDAGANVLPMVDTRARSLRRNMTEAETVLWSKLRDRQIDGRKFRRQVVIGPYIADFACLEQRLVVEVDGGQHAEAAEKDAGRTAAIAEHGFEVIRFWNSDVLKNTSGVVEEIAVALRNRATAPHVSRRRTGTPT